MAKLYGIDDIDRLTCLSPNGDGTRDLWFTTRDRAEIVSAALNQEIFARQIERGIEERGREGKMNKNKILKILENMKEIQDECRRTDDCSKCELSTDKKHGGRCLVDWNLEDYPGLPCYWNIDERIDEIKEAIELDEALAKKGD